MKSLRKNWVPPEEIKVENQRSKIEPGRLSISKVYCNDTREGVEAIRRERASEMEEVRQVVSRPTSAIKQKMSDDFWLKLENSNSDCVGEKKKLSNEIELVKQARNKFEEDLSER